jgi:shikimate dehydrogenase
MSNLKALILGTGGAAKAVEAVFIYSNLSYKTVSRTDKGDFTYKDLESNPELVEEYKLIVNTTPLGMSPHIDKSPQLPYDALGANHFLYDLIYNPAETLFLKLGKKKGANIKNGHEMLVLQAEKSWEIWNS